MPRERKNPLKNKNTNNEGNEDAGTGPKGAKKRRSSTAASQQNSINSNPANNANNNAAQNELIPPQPAGSFGDIMIAANPFDDTPSQQVTQPPNPPHTPSSQPQPPLTPHSVPSTPGTPLPQQTPPQQQQQPKPVPLMSGKIYPPEQSMVFNPANPNAPPIYPCGICHKEVHDNDQAILCESGCNFWFHRICTGLNERAYHLLNKEVYAEWVCDKCLNSKKIPLVKFKP